ncbi:hypothetical protein R1sor_010506 [Riccia sorocarpa]|uniref:Uncharacterized protein n=1 Tax=Riccia sorocarpa TaxID=122646 RepID=A0ABD3I1T4_9MARC
MCDEEAEILERCISRTWIVGFGRSENHREFYACIEYAETVSRKVLFRGSSPYREVPDAQTLPSSQVITTSAFGDGSLSGSTGTLTWEADYRGEKLKTECSDASRESFRCGFEAGFVTCTILVSVGKLGQDGSHVCGFKSKSGCV